MKTNTQVTADREDAFAVLLIFDLDGFFYY